MNAFIYTINDNVLHAYHEHINNEGELAYYNHRKQRNNYGFVRATLPNELKPNLYTIIDSKSNIDKIKYAIDTSSFKDDVNLVDRKYYIDNKGNEYWILRISSSMTNKLNSIKSIYSEGKHNCLVVCASGRSDLELVKQANLSICLNTAPEYVKEKCDLIINGDSINILKIIDKIYHSNNVNKTIEDIKKKFSTN